MEQDWETYDVGADLTTEDCILCDHDDDLDDDAGGSS